MIYIETKKDCVGCWACYQICPKKCIAMIEDEEGFLYPKVDSTLCIDCNLCNKVCPVENRGVARDVKKIYLAKNINSDIRKESSSGGFFNSIATPILERGGVVFGAAFNENNELVHQYVEDKSNLHKLCGSKYVQSKIENSFVNVKKFLVSEREVLFVGTPCQIAGLKLFLKKDYDNLILVDFVCHGVPSPGVFKSYLSDVIRKQHILKLQRVSFRNKRMGWRIYGFKLNYIDVNNKNKIFFESRYSNHFLRGFLSDIYLRPSCYACPSKSGSSGADLTISDFWAINKSKYRFLDDDKGISTIYTYSDILNTEKYSDIYTEEVTEIMAVQHSFKMSVNNSNNRLKFFERYEKRESVTSIVSDLLPKSKFKLLLALVFRCKTLLRNKLNR